MLQLADGRRLAWSEFGTPTGPVLILLDGTPSSRLEGLVLHHAALGGVRVLVPDRPGFGGWDPQPGRSLTDWARDVAALADQLGIQRFAVSGISAVGHMRWPVPRTWATALVLSSPSTHPPKCGTR